MHHQAREEEHVSFLAVLLAFFAAAPAGKLIPVDESSYSQLISSNKGKVTLVSFWATWCVPCREEVPQLVALEKRLQPKGLKVVFISADEVDSEMDARRFLAGKNVPLPSYQKVVKNDDKFIEGLDPKWSGALPALFLYDRNGKQVKNFIGETSMQAIEAEVKKLL
jgi:thiol-disulfide isomerase/thioredoxin